MSLALKRQVCSFWQNDCLEDVRTIGFDEGVKPTDWIDVYRRLGIDAIRGVLRDDEVAVLRAYAEGGGLLYNG